MPTVTPTLPQPALTAAPTKPVAAASPPVAPTASTPSSTVTWSPQAQSALAAAGHPAAPSSSAPTGTPAATPSVAHDSTVYGSLKNGIATAVTDVGDVIAGGAHAVVDGVETTLSAANTLVKSALELPFAAISKACDAVGSLVDDL